MRNDCRILPILWKATVLPDSKVLRNHMLSANLAILLFTPAAQVFSQILPCPVLKNRIDEKLKAKGVLSYELNVVPRSTPISKGKQFGTCDGGRRKIIYYRLKSGPPPSVVISASVPEANELKGTVDWPFHDSGSPCADCNLTDRTACCATCQPPANGLLARNQIAAQAAIAAKNGGCSGAVALLLQTQCHNSHAAGMLANHRKEVCDLLRQH